ncbi:MAG: hypothetical protein LBC86_06290 [Oscillospiraceae bacterium]|jgi:cytidylate kinase|nr:hypothetical protein [Oscillospiraceae bacterium]
MLINNAVIKHYLKNVMFINGTAYAGKSTTAKMLSDKYELIHCEENYNCVPDGILTPEKYPNLYYTHNIKDWQEFINRTPEVYAKWIFGNIQELIEFEITYLISISKSQKVIVDTNIPVDILREIADYNQVAIMLSPQSMSVEHFFDRDDKNFFKEKIMQSENPEKTMANFRNCIAKIHSKDVYNEFANSGFFTIIRESITTDTKDETVLILAKHFGLTN